MTCRSCGGGDLQQILNLGEQYLSDFRDDDLRPPKYPLNAVFCPGCYLVQLDFTVPREQMYHERYGFKSGVNNTIRADLRDVVDTALAWKPGAKTWLDIACNDGTLLSYVPERVRRFGIDPVEKYAREALQHGTIYFDYFDQSWFPPKFFDVVTAVSMFYDIDDLDRFIAGVKYVLKDDGLWVVQQNYLLSTLELNAVDNFCHEHLTYFSLMSLEKLLDRHGLEVVHVTTSTVNGGSFRTLITRKGKFPVRPSVHEQREKERDAGLDVPQVYELFARRVERELTKLRVFVRYLTESGKRVYVYGASTRGGTLYQSARLTAADLPFAVDRNPEKVGKRMSSIGARIIGEEQGRKEADHMLVSPWFFRDEFVQREQDYLRGGGHLIFPLPWLDVL